jgi:hypothetical protein
MEEFVANRQTLKRFVFWPHSSFGNPVAVAGVKPVLLQLLAAVFV